MPAAPTRKTVAWVKQNQERAKKSGAGGWDIPEFLRWLVDYSGGYKAERSLIPGYDDIWKYLDNIQKQKDYEGNTGRSQAYGSDSFTFANAANLVNSGVRTARNVTYSVGNLSKRL